MGVASEKFELWKSFRIATTAAHPAFRQPVEAQVQSFWGDYLNVVLPEPISTGIAFNRVHDKDLTHVLIECLDPGMTFFDIGAHYGYFTLLAAKIVGATGHVHAFEPSAESFDLLRKNSEGHANITLNQVAAYSEAVESLGFSEFDFRCSAFNSIFEPRVTDEQKEELGVQRTHVRAIAIDDYVAETGAKPNFIKVDAVRAEYSVLEGMQKTLTECRPILAVDLIDADLEGVPSCKRLVEFVCSFGYKAYQSGLGVIVPHMTQTRYENDNLLFLPVRRKKS